MKRWLRETAGGLPATFWYLWVGTVVNRLANFTMLFLEISLVFRYGFSISFAGLVLGLYGLGNALGSLVGGALADRWGRRPTLLLAHFSAALASSAFVLVTGGPGVALLSFGFGVCVGFAGPAFSAMVIDVVDEPLRLRAFSLNYWAINIGFSGAAIGAGLLAEAPLAIPFLLNAAALAAVGVLLQWRIPESRELRPAQVATSRHQSPGPAAAAAPAGALWQVFSDRIFMAYVLLNAVFWMIIEVSKLLPVTMQQDGLPAAAYGPVIAVNGVMIVCAQLFVPRLVGRRSQAAVLALAALLVGVGFGANVLVDGAFWYSITVAVWTLGEMVSVPAASALAAGLSPAAMRGRYQGVVGLGHSSARFAAPVLAGVALEHGGQAALWLGCLALGALIAGGQLLVGPGQSRRVAWLRAQEAPAAETVAVQGKQNPAAGESAPAVAQAVGPAAAS